MEASFRLAGDLKVKIDSDRLGDGGGVVRLIILRGVCYEHKPEDNVGTAEGPCPEIKAGVVMLTKPQARAVASAMMGCAAEL